MDVFQKWQFVVNIVQSMVLLATFLGAVFVGLKQIDIGAKQTEISDRQATIAQNQRKEQTDRDAFAYRADLAKLRMAILAIEEFRPLNGYAEFDQWDREKKAIWLAGVRPLLEAQTTNLALIQNETLFKEWMDACDEAVDLKKFYAVEDPTFKKMFVSVAGRIHTRVFNIGWGLGIIRNIDAPSDEVPNNDGPFFKKIPPSAAR